MRSLGQKYTQNESKYPKIQVSDWKKTIDAERFSTTSPYVPTPYQLFTDSRLKFTTELPDVFWK